MLGCVAPVAEIVAAARELPDCAVLLDACQSAPHMAIDVDQLGVDFLVASGHKMCGPTGIGFLWGKRERTRPAHSQNCLSLSLAASDGLERTSGKESLFTQQASKPWSPGRAAAR